MGWAPPRRSLGDEDMGTCMVCLVRVIPTVKQGCDHHCVEETEAQCTGNEGPRVVTLRFQSPPCLGPTATLPDTQFPLL